MRMANMGAPVGRTRLVLGFTGEVAVGVNDEAAAVGSSATSARQGEEQ